jgi:hypothetical protein
MCWVEKTSGPALPPVTISALCGAPLPPAAYLKPILVKKKIRQVSNSANQLT